MCSCYETSIISECANQRGHCQSGLLDAEVGQLEPAPELTFQNFVSSLLGHVIAISKTKR